MTSFSDLFKLGKEVLKTDTFVLHEAQTRGQGQQGRKCLVKCLFVFGLTKAERAQVGDDVRTFRRAKHSCILALQDVISEPEDRFCYMIYEHMPGGTLTEHLGTGRQFTEGEVKIIVSRVLMSLALLHSHGLFHGHVTPARIMFGSPGRTEAGAATARLCYLEKVVAPGDTWQAGESSSAAIEKDLRDSDIVSLGLTAFAALMGDAGAAAGEPLESYRATTESTGVPELSPLGREAIDLMLGTDPTEPIPSAAELLQHPWFPIDGVQNENAVAPMPLAPGQKVAIGPPARPEHVPVGLPPMVPKLSANNGTGAGGKGTGQNAGMGEKGAPWVEMPDGSQALSSWLVRKTSARNALGMKTPWQRRWFVLNPSTSMLLIYTHEVDLTVNEAESTRRSSGSIPKAYPLDCARISELVRPSVKETPSAHEHCLVLEDSAERFPSMFLSFPDPKAMGLWSNTFRSVKEVRAAGTRARTKPDASGRGGGGDDGVDWWDDVSHQAQRVAHVTAASAFAAGGGEAELSRFVEEKLLMHKRSAKSMYLNGSIKSGGTSLFGGGGSMVLPTSNNAGTIFKNSALQWERRVEELASVTAGKPINSAMLPGERWFIVDARWMDHWLEFCTSKRRMAPPGPVDNSWMLHSDKRHVPYDGLTLALGKQAGDYRRVGPECWDQLMRLYGGGPAIHVDGPPVEDLTRWVVRFGHQVSAGSGRRSSRHIPNPNVSVKNLKQAANQWVGGWDDEDDEDYESAEDDMGGEMMAPVLGSSPPPGMPHAKGPSGLELRGSFGSLATPLGVLREEDGMGEDRSGEGPTGY